MCNAPISCLARSVLGTSVEERQESTTQSGILNRWWSAQLYALYAACKSRYSHLLQPSHRPAPGSVPSFAWGIPLRSPSIPFRQTGRPQISENIAAAKLEIW
jgi:hypothetical protein